MLDAGLRLDAPPLIPCSTAVRRAPPPPNFQTRVCHHCSRTSAVRDRDLPSKSRKIGGNERPRRAHNLPPIPARMSARSRRKIFQTYLCGDGRPGPGRRRAGLGCCRPVLARGTPSRSSRSASLTTRSAFRKEQKRVRTECTRPGVTRDRVWTPRGGRGTGRKRRTLQDHVLSPFGRL